MPPWLASSRGLFYPRCRGSALVTPLLRTAAVYSLAWAIALAFPAWLSFGGGPPSPEIRSLAHGLAIANLGLAYLFHRAAAQPVAHRAVLYSAMLIFGLR